MQYKISDKVSFEARGAIQEGVITRLRIKENRKLQKFEAHFNLRSGLDHSTWVAEVMVGNRLWTVPTHMLTQVGTVDVSTLSSAVNEANQIKMANRAHKANRKSNRLGAAFDNGLFGLKSGDPIEVQFKDGGWRSVTFTRFNSGGNILFSIDAYREGKCSPKFARIPQVTT